MPPSCNAQEPHSTESQPPREIVCQSCRLNPHIWCQPRLCSTLSNLGRSANCQKCVGWRSPSSCFYRTSCHMKARPVALACARAAGWKAPRQPGAPAHPAGRRWEKLSPDEGPQRARLQSQRGPETRRMHRGDAHSAFWANAHAKQAIKSRGRFYFTLGGGYFPSRAQAKAGG